MVELNFRDGREHIVSTRALCAQNSAMRAQKVPFSHYKGHVLATFSYFLSF